MYEKERVLVVPSEKIELFVDYREGIVEKKIEDVKRFVRENGFFVNREKAEYDESTRQIIPYMALKDEDGFLVFKRLRTQGEKRLHDLLTIGIGGHIRIEDMVDEDLWNAVENGMMRELNEEVKVEIIDDPIFIGILNDKSKEVSRVHIGLCYIINVEFFGLNEVDKFEYFKVKDLIDITRYENLENWTRIFSNWFMESC